MVVRAVNRDPGNVETGSLPIWDNHLGGNKYSSMMSIILKVSPEGPIRIKGREAENSQPGTTFPDRWSISRE